MNYLTEIKVFYDRLLSVKLTAGQIALWHAFIEINNREGWSEWFSAPMTALCTLSGLSRSGVIKAIPVLAEKNYISVCKNRYSLCTQKRQNQNEYIYKKTKRNETKRKEFFADELPRDSGQASDDISARLD